MIGSVLLDIQRALALLQIGLKYGAEPLLRRFLHLKPRGPTDSARLRLALEELGTTYLKFGQFLAMRFDVLPLEVCTELNKLFESVPPMAFEEAQAVIESELKAPLHEIFPVFMREPIAAASVAQVHIAYTSTNEKLAVKVQRTGIDRLFAADMRNLGRLARVIDAIGIAGAISARDVAGQFANWTAREMDFETEGRTAERLRRNAAPFEVIPSIYWRLTTKRVLTMEFVEGMSLAKIGSMIDAGRPDLLAQALPNLDVELAGRNIAFAILRQLFVFGFFQGDPHPGNVFIREDNTVAFVDFGLFGELTQEQIENLAGFLENLALGNIETSFDFYSRQHSPTPETDVKAFEREGRTVLRLWYQTSISPFSTAKERHMGRYAVWIIQSLRRHRLRTDPEVLILWRALFVLDASSERLSDYFDMMGQVRAFFMQYRRGPVGRVATMLADSKRTAALLNLKFEGATRFGNLLSNLATANTKQLMKADESASLRRSRDREVKWLTLIVVGLSFIAMVGSPHLSALFKVIVFGIAIIVFFLAARQNT